MCLLHVHTRDITRIGNHFDVICLQQQKHTHPIIPGTSITSPTESSTTLNSTTTASHIGVDTLQPTPITRTRPHVELIMLAYMKKRSMLTNLNLYMPCNVTMTPLLSHPHTHEAVNTDQMIIMSRHEQDNRHISLLLPLSLPSSCNPRPAMWTFSPRICRGL